MKSSPYTLRLFALLLLLLSCSVQAALPVWPTEVQNGLSWLKARIAADGSIAGEADSIAVPLQTRQEVLATLQALGEPLPAGLAELIGSDSETDTESLARRILARQATGTDASQALDLLVQNQNGDGGFGALAAAESGPLDTAWALLALRQAPATHGAATSSAIAYLTAQAAGLAEPGSAQPLGMYAGGYGLQALEAHAGQYAVASGAEPMLADLLARQTAPGVWGDAPFLSALAYLAVRNFTAQEPLAGDLRAYLAATQAADGSWGGDPYVTALALRAWVASLTAPVNPLRAAIKGRLVDAQTLLPLAGVAVDLAGAAVAGTLSAADGGFVFSDLPAGDYSLQLSFAGYATLTTVTAVKTGQIVDYGEIRITKLGSATTGTITGTVKDASSGQPLAGVTVIANGGHAAATAADGSYQISNVPPGTVNLVASLAGYGDATGSATLAAGGMLLFSPSLSPQSQGLTLQGTVTDGVTGLPLAGVAVAVTGASNASGASDGQGFYSLSGLNTGLVDLSAHLAGYDPVTLSLVLSGSGIIDFSPRLYPAGTTPPGANTSGVAGVVLDAGSNAPLAGVDITATFGATVRTLVSDSEGRFQLADLDTSSADLAFALQDYQGVDIAVALKPLAILDIGQVRLRRANVEALLPDLVVRSASRAGANTDPQSLTVSGSLMVTVTNVGTAEALAEADLLAFHDENRNGLYDVGVDVVLGQASVPPLPSGAEQAVEVGLGGVLPFRDAPMHLMVDSLKTLAEVDEANNLAATSSACEVKPNPGSFAPKLKWSWTGSTTLSNHRQVMSMPVVAPLEDTNGDGRVDQDDVPAVIFHAFSGSNYQSDGVLRALSGLDGHELWTLADAAYRTYPGGTPAVADLDNDGHVDIVVPKSGGGTMAVDHLGRVKWTSAYPASSNYSAASIADLDGNGSPEIIFGNTVLNANGALFWQGSGYAGGNHSAAVVDLDLDGRPEVVAGAAAYTSSGQRIWQNSTVGDGYVAIGNLNGDGYPEIVVKAGSKIYLLTHDGKILWGPVSMPGGGGGPPTIADMDGDGVPEIGVAGSSKYVVLRADGSILWTSPIQDYSSASTGSSVFDFDGDGNAEVVYADELNLRVYDGKSGTVLFSTPNTSGTLSELPVIADVDGDGHAEIVLCINDYVFKGYGSGIRVFSDTNNSWVPTRRIWNQHSYHITNINEDGTVPRVEENSWQVHNTYRLNAQPGISATATADLTASWLRVQDNGGLSPSKITVRIGNGGARAAPPGTPVAFYNGEPGQGGSLLGLVSTSRELASGEYEDLGLEIPGALSHIAELWVAADDDGSGTERVTECDELNNRVSAVLGGLAVNLSLGVATDRPSYGPDNDVAISAAVGNAGSFPQAVSVQFTVLGAADAAVVAILPPTPLTTVAANGSQGYTAVWNTGATYASTYAIEATLLDAAGHALARAQSGFAITVAGGVPAANASITTDKLVYQPYDQIALSDRIRNATANSQLDGLIALTQVTTPAGEALFSQTATLGQLAPGAAQDLAYSLELSNALAGDYRATLSVSDAQGVTIAQSEYAFSVASSAATGAGLSGSLAAIPAQVPVGGTAVLDFTVSNAGNAPLTALPLTLSVVDPAAQQVLASWPYSIDLAPGASYPGSTAWSAAGAAGTPLVAVLSAELAGKTLTLAQANLALMAPAIKLELTAGIDPAARLLVLVSCLPGEGGHGDDHHHDDHDDHDGDHDDHDGEAHGDDHGAPADACAVERAQWLDAYLAGLGLAHHIATSVEDFTAQFYCGRYDVYWLSGGSHKLDGDLSQELGEAVRRGGLLLQDGVHDQRNSTLDSLAGLKYKGKLPGSGYGVELLPPLFAGETLNVPGTALKFQLAGATLQARFLGASGEPALASRAYGSGASDLYAFDLLAGLQAGGWDAPWQTLLAAYAPQPPAAYPGGAWVPLTYGIANQGQASAIAATAHLPADVALDGLPADATLDAAGNPVWQFDLAGDATRRLALAVRAPAASGAYTVPLQVATLNNGQSTPYGEVSTAFQVAAADTLGPALPAAIRALAPTKNNERQARDQAAKAVEEGLAELAAGDAGDALEAFLDAAEQLARIGSVPISAQQFDLAMLIGEAEARLCGAPVCPDGDDDGHCAEAHDHD